MAILRHGMEYTPLGLNGGILCALNLKLLFKNHDVGKELSESLCIKNGLGLPWETGLTHMKNNMFGLLQRRSAPLAPGGNDEVESSVSFKRVFALGFEPWRNEV